MGVVVVVTVRWPNQSYTIPSWTRLYSKTRSYTARPNATDWKNSRDSHCASKVCNRAFNALPSWPALAMPMPIRRITIPDSERIIWPLLFGVGPRSRGVVPCKWKWKSEVDCKFFLFKHAGILAPPAPPTMKDFICLHFRYLSRFFDLFVAMCNHMVSHRVLSSRIA